MMRRFALMSVAAILLLGIFLTPVPESKAAQPDRYGYSLLKNDNQRAAYHAWAEGIEQLSSKIIFTASSLDSIGNDVITALEMVQKDYPEYFWTVTGNLKISSDPTTKQIEIYDFQYYFNGIAVTANSSNLNLARAQVEQAVIDALKTLPQNPSDYEIALTLHDYLVNNVQYLSVGDHQTAYGALVGGKAVCAGYARAYQLLMNSAGIPCTYITGKSVDPQMLAAGVEDLQPHAWNLVWLDGKCYYTDVTWDDQGVSGLFHEYLNISLEEISMTHFPGANEILPASCNHDNYRFFIQNSSNDICDIQEHKDVADIANCFVLKSIQGRNAEYYCTIHYHPNDFSEWFAANYKSIGEKLGYESFECGLIEIGHEHHVTYVGVLAETAPQPSVTPTEEPTQTQNPTQESSTPTQGSTASTQATTQATQTTEPSVQESVPASDPTTPVEPTESVASPTESKPANSTVEGNVSGSIETSETTSQMPVPSEAIVQSEPTAPTASAEQQESKEDSSGTVAILISAVVLIGAGIGASLYFIRKKR